MEEVFKAIILAKNNKKTKPDQVPVEIIKKMEEIQIGTLVDLYNSVYSTGIISRTV